MILHIDMDAFYASVEQLDRPELAGKPVIVGGTSNRGVVCAASYAARSFGVRSAMPMFQARRLCPGGVFLPPRFERYKAVSENIMSILRAITPLVEQVSIDEAYMDVSGCEKRCGPPEAIAAAVKRQIRDAVGLTCSVGIAPAKFLAKIASAMNKPDGLTVIREAEVPEFIASLPIRKVPGVGEQTQKRLDEMGIKTLGEANRYAEAALLNRLGKFGKRLGELARGIDTSAVSPEPEHKSISAEETLGTDTRDKAFLAGFMLRQAEDVARQLRRLEVRAKTVTLKVKHADFTQVTRRTTLSHPTCSSKTIYQEAMRLLSVYPLNKKVRLVGVGASGLLPKGTPIQMDLFSGGEKTDDRWEKVDRTVDAITRKFGENAVQRGTSKGPE